MSLWGTTAKKVGFALNRRDGAEAWEGIYRAGVEVGSCSDRGRAMAVHVGRLLLRFVAFFAAQSQKQH